jgi:hemerythrin-like domain-containing protein
MATERMQPSELAAWMRAEHDALRRLTDVLKQHIAAMPELALDEWLHGLRVAFDRLRAHLERNFAAQERDGYLDDLIARRPSVAREVARLKCEHGELMRMADRIRAELAETAAEDRLLVADGSARIQRFIAVVSQHEQREDTLTLVVYNEDLGGES